MKTKLLLFCILSFIGILANAQTPQFSPGGIFETVYDQFGNQYNLNEILISNNNIQNKYIDPTCDSGIFRLHFENGCGFENPTDPTHTSRRDIACQVFKDLSDFIITPLHDIGNMNKVDIWVKPYELSPQPDLIGNSSGFYTIPSYSSNINGGILDNEVWKTIHLGTNSYSFIAPLNYTVTGLGSFYHGYFSINFNVNWNLDLNNLNPLYNDLYSAILHQAVHILGINSLIDSNGMATISIGGGNQYYNRYDTFLFNSLNNPLLTPINTQSQLYENSFTAQLSDIQPNNPSAPCDSETTLCQSVVNFSGINISNLPIHTPECFTSSSLSHFEDICINGQLNDRYFVMSNVLGRVKRFLQEEERKALCEIGYNLQSSYGSTLANNLYNYTSTGCTGILVAGDNDGFESVYKNFTFRGNANTSINISEILNNDINATNFEGLEDVYDSSAVLSTTFGDTNTIISFQTAITGVHLLRYVPYNNITNKRGNITYIFVHVLPEFSQCYTSASECDLIINGNFEEKLSTPTDQGEFNKICNWSKVHDFGTPDFYHRMSGNANFSIPNNSFGIENDINGDSYAGIVYVGGAPFSNSMTQGYRELIKTKLKSPLEPNTTYQLEFDVSLADNYAYNNNYCYFQAYLSEKNYSYPLPIDTNQGIIITPDDLNGIHLKNSTASTISNGWDRIKITFTTGQTAGQEYLYLGKYDNDITSIIDSYPHNNGPLNTFNLYYYLDNVSLIKVEYLNMPNEFCLDTNNSTLSLNLIDFLSPLPSQIGTFSGLGVTGNVFTTTQPGTYTIEYTYFDDNNCEITEYNSFVVFDCNTTTTPIIPDFDSFCLNEGITSNPLLGSYLNENNMSIIGTWSPSTIDTSLAGTFDYVFTPNPNQNALSVIKSITITNPITPIFNAIQPICKSYINQTLPNVSDNGINGTWSPSIIDTSVLGTSTYTFTPNSGECAIITTLNVEIIDCSISLTWGSDVSCEQTIEDNDPRLPGNDNINDGPCIKVCENSTINYSLTGDSSIILDTQWNITGGSVNYEDNASCEISWNGSSFAFIEAIVTLINGDTITIHRCVEKLETPTSLFSLNPNSTNICSNTPISFDNLSIAGSGNGEIYYNWTFGDGNSSTEFEPTHTYTDSGTYLVALRVYNGCSCEDIYEMEIVIGEGLQKIECNGIICEGQIGNYTIDSSCSVHFEVQGGSPIVNSNNQVIVLWDNIDSSGFGTISTNCEDGCISSIKIPVIQNEGKINGSSSICENQQQIYRLPQWPTTDFNWTLDDGGTGATLILNNQRNEIIVQSNTPGNLTLYCNYQNTLLGCGGASQLNIEVLPDLTLSPITPVCINTNSVYQFIAEGLPITQPISYLIEGPNNYSLTGSGTSVSFTPTIPGIYNVIISSSNYCTNSPLIIKVLEIPVAPTQIIGETNVCPTTPYVYSVPALPDAIANWSVNGGTILGNNTGNSVLIQFDTSATPPYEVNVFYSRLGCDGIPATLEVNPDIPVVSFIQAPTPVCASSIANYEITSNTDLDFINWSIIPSNAGSIINGQNTKEIQVNWNNIGSSAIVRATIRKCGIEHVFDTSVIVNLAPIIEIVADTEACAGNGNPVSFSVNGISSGIVTWNFGDGNTGVGQTVIHPFSEPLTTSTQYNVSVTVQNPNGCINTATASHLITISPSPIINLDHAPFLNVCYNNNQPGDYDFSIVLQGGWAQTNVPSIVWRHNGNIIANNTPTLIIDENSPILGNYQATVTNSFGCSATTPIIRVVSDCPSTTNCTVTESIDINLNNNCDTITIEATPTGTPDKVVFKLSNGQTFVDTDTPYQATFNNLQPGEYVIEVSASNDPYVNTCWTSTSETFILPYEPDFKFEVSCNGNETYNLTLLDHSRYYNPIGTNPITNYEFTINGGANWTAGTLIGTVFEAEFTGLQPDVYDIGIRIQGGTFMACTRIEPLELEVFPTATFTQSHTEICEGEPVTFTPDDINPNWTYNWTFGDGSENSNPTTQKTFDFNNGGSNQIIFLEVRNRFGCSSISSGNILIFNENIEGELIKDNDMVCLGTPVTLSFNSTTGTQTPDELKWYKDNLSNPINITPPALTLVVTEPGYYFAYGYNVNNCITTTGIKEVIVTMIPAPMLTIEGPEVLCFGNDIILNTINTPNTNYYWSVNGTELPDFNGLSTINYSPTSTGNYVFELVTETLDGQNNPCLSLPSIHEVTVLESPQIPVIDIIGVQCMPYQVTATVTNPQPGVVYYWSNGNIGTTAAITHDGPIQVRAEAFGCSETSQIDLPLDLKQHEWLFPKGCFEYCKFENFNGYIIGPLGEIKWTWFHDAQTDSTGDGLVNPISVTEGVYDFAIANTWCDLEIGTATVKANECINCDISIEPLDIYCDTVFGTNVYAISLQISNNMNGLSLSLTAPNGEGYFSPSTFQVPVSSNTIYNGYFIPNSSFSGGGILINIEGADGIEVICSRLYELNLNCEGTPRIAEPKDKIILSPNPTKNKAEVLYELTESGPVQLLVTDISGRELFIFENINTSGKFEIDLSLLPEGYYPVTLVQNGVIIYSSKLIKN